MRKLFLVLLSTSLLLSACTDYGKKVSITPKSDVYYKGDGVTEADAIKLGNYLKSAGYFDSSKAATLQIMKDTDAYLVKMVIAQDVVNKEKDLYKRLFWYMQDPISQNVFNGKKTKIIFANDDLNDIEPVGDIAKFNTNPLNRVLYNPSGVTEEDAKKLSDFFTSQGYFNGSKNKEVLLNKENDAYNVRFMVDENVLNTDKENFLPYFKVFNYLINKEVYKGRKTNSYLTNLQMKDIEQVPQLTNEEIEVVEKELAGV